MFLDPRLEASSSFIISLELCQARLHHNAAFPWILLIPEQDKISEIIDLSPPHQLLLMQEIGTASKVMRHLFDPTKLNVASLGNIVPQLHVHVVARYTEDAAWPNPIWNSGITAAYTPETQMDRITQIKAAFCIFGANQ